MRNKSCLATIIRTMVTLAVLGIVVIVGVSLWKPALWDSVPAISNLVWPAHDFIFPNTAGTVDLSAAATTQADTRTFLQKATDFFDGAGALFEHAGPTLNTLGGVFSNPTTVKGFFIVVAGVVVLLFVLFTSLFKRWGRVGSGLVRIPGRALHKDNMPYLFVFAGAAVLVLTLYHYGVLQAFGSIAVLVAVAGVGFLAYQKRGDASNWFDEVFHEFVDWMAKVFKGLAKVLSILVAVIVILGILLQATGTTADGVTAILMLVPGIGYILNLFLSFGINLGVTLGTIGSLVIGAGILIALGIYLSRRSGNQPTQQSMNP